MFLFNFVLLSPNKFILTSYAGRISYKSNSILYIIISNTIRSLKMNSSWNKGLILYKIVSWINWMPYMDKRIGEMILRIV